MLDLIRDLRARIGMTVVFVTHDLAVARLMGDRIAVMQAGRGRRDSAPPSRSSPQPREDYTRTLLAAVPEIAVERSRLDDRRTHGRPRTAAGRSSVGGARLGRPIGRRALVGLLGLVTLVALFARLLAPVQPGPAGRRPQPAAAEPRTTCSAPTRSAATCFAAR